MENIVINSVAFPKHLFGKSLDNWEQAERLLIVQARKHGASLRDISNNLDIDYQKFKKQVNLLLPQASGTPEAVLKRNESKILEIIAYGEPLTEAQVANIFDISHCGASLLLSFVPVYQYRKNNSNFKPFIVTNKLKRVTKKYPEPALKVSTKDLSKSDLEELRHLHYTVDLAQKRIKQILDSYKV